MPSNAYDPSPVLANVECHAHAHLWREVELRTAAWHVVIGTEQPAAEEAVGGEDKAE